MGKYILILVLTGSGFRDPRFELSYKCSGKKGKVTHIVNPHPSNCQLTMYAVLHELGKACKTLEVEESYCGYKS